MGLSHTLSQDDLGNQVVPSIIHGEQIVLPSSTSFPVVNAKTQTIVHHAQTTSIELATQAVESAAKAFNQLKRVSGAERRRLLLRAAEIWARRADEVIQRDMSETSAPEFWSAPGVKLMPAAIKEMAGAISSVFAGEIHESSSGKTSLVYKESVGPVLVIPPWNAASQLATLAVASALAAGCSVVLKASELCPWTHHFVAEVFHEAGFPPGSVNFIVADRPAAAEVTEALIAHPDIRHIEFIGSAAIGRIIGRIAATHLKPLSMELGDQSPAIVLDDADLKHAANLCALGTTLHHGQVCFGTERIIVQSSVKDEFIGLLKEAMRNSPAGQSAVSKTFAEKSKAIIDEAIAHGAKFLIGDSEMTGPSSVNSSILVNVAVDSAIYANEVFGPTAALVVVDTEESAIAEANSRPGGLSASIFTQSHERGLRLARELEFGMVKVNDMTIGGELSGPISCYKGSGWGSSGGKYSVEKFVYNKSVTLKAVGNTGA